MKRLFINSVIVFLCVIGSLFVIQNTFFNEIWFKKLISYFGIELYEAIVKAETSFDNINKVVFGDSAGNQLFGQIRNDKNNTLSLTCNQATTLVGQYILMEKFFRNNKGLGGIAYLVYHPASFENDLNLKYTYHYLLKPFYNNECKKYFDERSDSIVRKIPYYQFCQIPIIKMTKWSPHYSFLEALDFDKFYLSKTSLSYISKMNNLCKENDFEFEIVAPIINENYRGVKNFSKMKTQIVNHGLEDLFAQYFVKMTFASDTLFRDEIHFKNEYLPYVLQLTEIDKIIFM